MELVGRHIQSQIEGALEWARVVMIHGARQSGKTTLAKAIVKSRGGTYVSLDDEAQLELAKADPVSYLADQRHPLVVDEFQLAGDRLIRAVKQLVDAEQTPGRFLLAGSTNFLTVPNISESLAGRVQTFRLSPLSEAELAGTRPTEINSWFEGAPRISAVMPITRDEYLALLCRGGYPEVIGLDSSARRRWFRSYIETVVQRDIAALADIRRTAALPSLLQWTAGLTSSHVNLSDAARKLQVSRPVIASYFEWLQNVFLVHELSAWTRNLAPRPARRPKFHLTDSGLAASLLRVDPEALTTPTAAAAGPLLETFAVNEIERQLSASDRDIGLSHYRDSQGREIDLILEGPNGGVVAVEIKATRSPNSGQLQHLAWLRDKLDIAAPSSFRAGVLLHTGDQSGKIGDRLHLRPINSLWTA
ncbi:MAG: ATP-binding protein [Acidimicrobiaceae bacterium]|nr:ATP-binding protein [Acidimicrobiaceae bacterium]